MAEHMPTKVHTIENVIVWVRRELRVHDHLALWMAARDGGKVIPLFVVDKEFRSSAPAKQRVMVEGLRELRMSLRKHGGDVIVRCGEPAEVLHRVLRESNSGGVYLTKDYHPEMRRRDQLLRSSVESAGKLWKEWKDYVLFEEQDILSSGKSTPFTVFTAYRRAWKARHMDIAPPLPPVRKLHLSLSSPGEIPEPGQSSGLPGEPQLSSGGERSAAKRLKEFLAHDLSRYHEHRDHLALRGTSRLSHHFATGSLGIRSAYHALYEASSQLRGLSRQGPDAFLNELIWREFYYQILANFPHVVRGSFKGEYDDLQWSDNEHHFQAWCAGQTGYPVVDAAMRQLNAEGWMHNRARMIVANFLIKNLHMDWKRGEKYFMQHLADGDVALNNGGWQWCAGTGNDAQPWFRIFNPVLQSRKFDAVGEYIKHYVPELRRVPLKFIHEPWLMPRSVQVEAGCLIGKHYPAPIVDHDRERKRTLEIYSSVTKAK